jgi:hypothetical protein
MPLTFTAPIEEIPGLIALTLQSSDRKSALELLSTTGRFPPPWTDERNWSPLIANMTVEQAATLKGLAEAAYELDAFKPKLTRAEADQRIAMLTAKLKLLDEPPKPYGCCVVSKRRLLTAEGRIDHIGADPPLPYKAFFDLFARIDGRVPRSQSVAAAP